MRQSLDEDDEDERRLAGTDWKTRPQLEVLMPIK